MKPDKQASYSQQRRTLLLLCRFLGLGILYRFMPVLLSVTGIFLTLTHRTQFAPYGISLLCLLIPSFLNNSPDKQTKKENSDTSLSVLYKRYHYSPSAFSGYRITILLCEILLIFWHILQNPVLTVCGFSLPLLYLAVCLALYPVLSHILFRHFHRKLMNGSL